MPLPDCYIDSTRFVLDKARITYADYHNPENVKLGCASLLKPLYLWSAAHSEPFQYQDWASLTRQAITVSSNEAMNKIWKECGALPILSQLTNLTSVDFGQTAIKSWGSLMIDADMVARAYGALLTATKDDNSAAQMVALLKQVKSNQTFLLADVVKRYYPKQFENIGIKCGWYVDPEQCRLRAHAVVIVERGNEKVFGFVILTSVLVGKELVSSYLKTYDKGEEVLAIHEAIAGNLIREELSRLLHLRLNHTKT